MLSMLCYDVCALLLLAYQSTRTISFIWLRVFELEQKYLSLQGRERARQLCNIKSTYLDMV